MPVVEQAVKTFGELLRMYRGEMSQMELARRVQRVPSDISRWETGDRRPPDRDTILDLAGALQLDPDETNRLLYAAGYATISDAGLDFGSPAVRSVAVFLASDEVSPEEKGGFQQEIVNLARIWTDYTRTDPRQRDSGEEYIKLLDDFNQAVDRLKIRLWTALGKSSARQSRFGESLSWYRRAQWAAEQLDDPRWKGRLLINMGDTFRDQNNPDAIRQYRDAVEEFESIGDKLSAARSRRKEASAYLAIPGTNPAKARDLLKRAHKELSELLSTSVSDTQRNNVQQELCRTLYFWGWAYSLDGEPEEGIKVRSRGLNIAEELNHSYLLTQGFRLLGDDFENRNQLEKAEESYREALNHCDDIEDEADRERERGNILRGLGATLIKLGDFTQAQECLNDSSRIFQDDPRHVALTLIVVGNLYAARQDYQRAFDEYWRARAIFEWIGNKYYATSALLRLAETSYELGDLPQAKEWVEDAKTEADKTANIRRLADAHWVHAKLLLWAGDPIEETRTACIEFYQIAQEAKVLVEYNRELTDLVSNLIDRQWYKEAKVVCDSFIEFSEDRAEHEIVVRLAEELKDWKRTAEKRMRQREEGKQALKDLPWPHTPTR